MMKEPRPYEAPVRARWSKTFAPTSQLERDRLLTLTNERRCHHLVHAEVGDTVTLLGTITAVAFVPSTPAQRESGIRRAVFTLDDGTGTVDFEADADDGLLLLSATVEVSGTIRGRNSARAHMDASLVEVLYGGRGVPHD